LIASSFIACVILCTSMTPIPGSASLAAPAHKPSASFSVPFVAETKSNDEIATGEVATSSNALTETVYVAIVAQVLSSEGKVFVIIAGRNHDESGHVFSINPLRTNAANFIDSDMDLIEAFGRII
jgi:hypothetical protein